ncbi:hypothetical protein EV714DRAFT_273595 [Schizophyllum commune]
MELLRTSEGISLCNGFLLYSVPPRDMLYRGLGLRPSQHPPTLTPTTTCKCRQCSLGLAQCHGEGQPNDMLDMYTTFKPPMARKLEQYRPRYRQISAFTFVNSPTPRKSVNTLPSPPNATNTGSSMILAASPFQAHDGSGSLMNS